MLSLCDAGLADIDRELSAVDGFDQLGEGATVIAIHFEREFEFICRQIAEIEAIELLGKAVVRDLGNDQRFGLLLELLQQVHDLAERDLIGQRNIAISAVFVLYRN